MGLIDPIDGGLNVLEDLSLVCVNIVFIVFDLLVLSLNVSRQLIQILVAIPDVYFEGLQSDQELCFDPQALLVIFLLPDPPIRIVLVHSSVEVTRGYLFARLVGLGVVWLSVVWTYRKVWFPN